ncbi:hypothetical protein J1N35_044031 [Gossypium stocksii]|uniref:Uncharacterized protein n=1 Tax=Gossypium stocksii TaxID=47602 RepID=A0A9D3U8G8_9ROSI|nr:hypothetical protein J1N35_044031 [Gossypium stocksii]
MITKEEVNEGRHGCNSHRPETQISFRSLTRNLAKPHQMDTYEMYSERTVKGAHSVSSHKLKGARGINSQELKGVRSPSSHTPREFAWRGSRTLACDLEWYTCPTCLRPTQSVSPMNSGVKS